MRLTPIALVAAREIREALRSRWFLICAGAFCTLSLGLALLGLAGSQRAGLAGYDRTTASLLALALLFVPLLGLALGSASLAGELEDGALGLLLAQPLTRLEVYAGKYAGLFGAIAAAVLLGFGATGLIVGLSAGSDHVGAFLALVGVVLLLAAASLAMGVALSAVLRSRAKAAGAAFAAWLVLVYLSDLGSIGLVLARELSPEQLFGVAMANPVQQARVLGMLALTDRLELLGTVGAFGIDHFGVSGLAALLGSTLVFGALTTLTAGYVGFRRTPVP